MACITPLPAGQNTMLRLADDVAGVEYSVPCVVEWGTIGTPSAMALRVDGVPARMSCNVPAGIPWGSSIGWAAEPIASAE